MRFVVYIKTGNTESMLYDSEAGSREYFISNPKLKLELNKAGSFGFTILPMHPLYDSFQRMKTYVRILLDDEEIYRGRVIQIEDTTWMERNVQCEGDLAYLNDSVQYPDQTESTTQNSDIVTTNTEARDRITDAEMKKKMPSESISIARVNISAKNANHESVQNHFIRYLTVHHAQMNAARDFGIGNVTVEDRAEVQDFTSTNYRDTLSAIEDDLLRYYGGFLQTRRSGDVVYLDWLENPGGSASQPIKMGMNLIDLQQQASDMNVFSRLIPVGDNQLTIESVNDNKNYIQNNSVYNKYGAIYKTESFGDVSTAAELKRQARAWMKKNCKDDPISLTVKAIDMHLLDGSIQTIKLGTKVNVISEPHGISLNLYVTSIEYDIQNPENNSYEIGDPYETLSQKTKKKKQSTERSISAASTTASSASRRAGNVETAVNRHAATISDIATGMYNIQADTLNITARVVTVEADELTLKGKVTNIESDLLNIHTKALKIEGETVEITSDYAIIGNIIMGDPPGTSGDYEMHLIGDTLLQGDLDVGGEINTGKLNINVEGETGGLYINDERVNILDIERDSQNPNVLHIYKADGTQIDFSRATTLSGTWSGSLPAKTLTVSTDDPQGPTYLVQFEGTYAANRTNLEVHSAGSLAIETDSVGAKRVTIPIKVQRLTGAQSEPETVYETTINAAHIGILTPLEATENKRYNLAEDPDHIGYSYVDVNVVPVLSGTWADNTLSVTSNPSGNTYQVQVGGTPSYSASRTNLEVVSNGAATVSKIGSTKYVDVPVKVQRLTGAQTAPVSVYETTLNPIYTNLLTPLEVTTNGSYNLADDDNHIGFSYVNVNTPMYIVYDPAYDDGYGSEKKVVRTSTTGSGYLQFKLYNSGTPRSNEMYDGTERVTIPANTRILRFKCGGNVVEELSLTDYRLGWNAAADATVVPLTENLTSSISITVPAKTLYMPTVSYPYDLSADYDHAYLKWGDVIVAQADVPVTTVSADKGSMIDGQWEADTWSSTNKMTVRLFKNGTQVSGGFVVDASGIVSNAVNAVTVTYDKGTMKDGEWLPDTWSSGNKMTVRLYKSGSQVKSFEVDASGLVSAAVKGVTVSADKGSMIDGEWEADTWSSANKMTIRLFKDGTQVSGGFTVDASGLVSNAIKNVTVSADAGTMVDGEWQANTWSTGHKMTIRLYKNGTQVSGGLTVDASSQWNDGAKTTRIYKYKSSDKTWHVVANDTQLGQGTYRARYVNAAGDDANAPNCKFTVPEIGITGLSKVNTNVMAGVSAARSTKFTAYIRDGTSGTYMPLGNHYWYSSDSEPYSSDRYTYYYK